MRLPKVTRFLATVATAALAALGAVTVDAAPAAAAVRIVCYNTSQAGPFASYAVQAASICELLGLGEDVAESLALQPSRGTPAELMSDPTIYRFTEALSVYGPALKALIHEEFGDGIMSAINFQVNFTRRPDPDGDRVVITLDGKFLDYKW